MGKEKGRRRRREGDKEVDVRVQLPLLLCSGGQELQNRTRGVRGETERICTLQTGIERVPFLFLNSDALCGGAQTAATTRWALK